MKTQDEINKAALKVANKLSVSAARLAYSTGFSAGATFANGYSVEDVCGFAEWMEENVYRLGRDTWIYNRTEMTLPDLLQIYKNREK